MKLSLALCSTLIAAAVCSADGGDDTLRYYLDRFELVVIGAITEQFGASFGESGVPEYPLKLSVQDVLKGKFDKSKTLDAVVVRFESHKGDEVPCMLKKGENCILFLKKSPTKSPSIWVSADPWFGIQHGSPTMAQSLKRLAKEVKDK